MRYARGNLIVSTPVGMTLSWDLILTGFVAETSHAEDRFQYQSGEIAIPAASANEAKVQAFGVDSIRAATKYLDDGALAWTRERSCMACHTTGVYLAERPALTALLGKPLDEVRAVFVAAVPADPVAGQPDPNEWHNLASDSSHISTLHDLEQHLPKHNAPEAPQLPRNRDTQELDWGKP